MIATLPVVDEIGEPPRRPSSGTDDLDRLETLEHQVRQLMSRLAGWVEAQLVQAVEDRRSDMRALRSELQAAVADQVAAARAENGSLLTVAVRRLTVNQEELGERLDDVVGRANEAAKNAAASTMAVAGDADRLEAFEGQLNRRIRQLTDSVQTVRAELESAVAERLDAVVRQAEQAWEGVSALRASTEAETARAHAFEERLRSAMRRLGESLEAKVAELAGQRLADLEQAQAADASVIGSVVQRIDGVAGQAARAEEAIAALSSSMEAETARVLAFEEQVRSAVARLSETVDARLAQATSGRQAEAQAWRAEAGAALEGRLHAVLAQATHASESVAGLAASLDAEAARSQALEERVRAVVSRLTESVEALAATSATRGGEPETIRVQLEEAVTKQVTDARTQIAAAIAGANKRFVRGQEQLSERLEALEMHTRRTDERLTQLVEAKIAAMTTGDPEAAIAAVKIDLEEALEERLGEVRSQIAGTAADAEANQAATRGQVEGQVTELGGQVAELSGRLAAATSGLGGLGDSLAADQARMDTLETRGHELEERLAQAIDAQRQAASEERAAERAGLSAELSRIRSELVEAATAQTRTSSKDLSQLRKGLEDVVGRVEKLASAVAASASAEAGALAPLRSDVRMLQTQVSELTEARGEARARRQPAPRKKPAPAKSPQVAKRAPRATKSGQ